MQRHYELAELIGCNDLRSKVRRCKLLVVVPKTTRAGVVDKGAGRGEP